MDIKVRVNETDAMGIINNAKYFTYMEEGRFDFINKLNLQYEKNETFIVAKATCEYIKPGQFGQTLNVETVLKEIGEKSLTLHTNIKDKDKEELIAKGEAIIVYYRIDLQKSLPLPEKLKDQLKEHLDRGEVNYD